MVQLDLTKGEKEILIEVLESNISDLRMEIADTDNLDFRETLKSQKKVLAKVLEALR